MPDASRPIEIDDLYNLIFVADPNISPDGRKVAWVATIVDRDKNGYRSSIWLAPSDPIGGSVPVHGRQKQGHESPLVS